MRRNTNMIPTQIEPKVENQKEEKKQEPINPAIRLKNGHLKFLNGWLDTPLHGDQSRTRSRFLKMILPRLQEIEIERLNMLKDLADKDKDKKPIIENHSYKLAPDKLQKFTDYQNERDDEEFVIDILESNRKTLSAMKVLLADDIGNHVEFTKTEGIIYNEILEAFEVALKA